MKEGNLLRAVAMSEWSRERVASEAEAWVWIPPEAVRIETPSYLLSVVPGSYAYTYLHWFRCDAARADATIDEVLGHVRAHGGTGLRWIVRPSSSPRDLGERLRRRGFEQRETAEVLYVPLGAGSPPQLWRFRTSDGITTREATTDQEFDEFQHLAHAVFGDPPLPDEVLRTMRAQFHEIVGKGGHSGRFLSYDGTTPVGRGGLEVVGAVGRLWGAGVVTEHRGKGAYLAVVAERCRSAQDQGAEIALTMARIGTSGPILKRHGFQVAGSQQTFELPAAAAGK